MAYLNDKPVWEEGVRKLELTDDCEASVFNEPYEQLARRTKYLKQAVEAEKTARQEGMAETASRLNAVEGRGGPVAAHDFATETPAQEAMTRYACEAVWGAGGTFAWNSGNPAVSTCTAGGVVHTAAEIFNST